MLVEMENRWYLLVLKTVFLILHTSMVKEGKVIWDLDVVPKLKGIYLLIDFR